MNKLKKYKEVFLIISLIVLDQVLKRILPKNITVIEGALKFTYVENTGGAFGTLSSETAMIVFSNIIVLAMIIRFRIIQSKQMTTLTKFGILCILSGGISNLLDRLINGYVIDFIDITPLIKFPVFNLADIFLTIGWICLILGMIRIFRKDRDINAI